MIGDLVGKNELKSAIKLLHQRLKTSPKLDEVIVQSSRLSDLMKQIRNDTISFEDANITKNKIRMGILSLVSEIEELVLNDVELQQEFKEKMKEQPEPKTQQIHYGSGDNIAGNKTVNN